LPRLLQETHAMRFAFVELEKRTKRDAAFNRLPSGR